MVELLRPASSVLVEAHDEWQVADKRYLSETTLALLNPLRSPTTNPLQFQPQSRLSIGFCTAAQQAGSACRPCG